MCVRAQSLPFAFCSSMMASTCSRFTATYSVVKSSFSAFIRFLFGALLVAGVQSVGNIAVNFGYLLTYYVAGPLLLNGRCSSLLRAPVSKMSMTYTVSSGNKL